MLTQLVRKSIHVGAVAAVLAMGSLAHAGFGFEPYKPPPRYDSPDCAPVVATPLPPALWAGLATMAGLGVYAALRRSPKKA